MEKFENLGLEELTTDEMMNVDGGIAITTAIIVACLIADAGALGVLTGMYIYAINNDD